MFYVLFGSQVIEVKNTKVAMLKQQDSSRLIFNEYLENGTRISTVFLGMSHNFSGDPGDFFETMVFSASGESLEMERYDTMDQAIAGHKMIVDKIKSKIASDDNDLSM